MSEPERITERTGLELAGALLRSMRHDTPPRGAKARTLAALGLGAGLAGVTANASAAIHALAAGAGVAKVFVIGAAIGGLTVGTVVLVQPEPSRTHVPSHATPTFVAPTVALEAPSVAPLAQPSVGSPLGSSLAPPPISPASSAASLPPSLADEVRALDAIRASLRAGSAHEALRQLDRYGTDFPAQQLAAEASMLRVQALVAAGRRAEAQALARAFVAQNPASPLGPRVRSLAGIE